MKKIEIDDSKCIGAGNCQFRAPNTFEVGVEGISQVLDVSGDSKDLILLARDECPSHAITIQE